MIKQDRTEKITLSTTTPEDAFFFFYTNNSETHDIFTLECGMERCDSNKPTLKRCYNYFALHYVVSGEGFYKIRNQVYRITENHVFAFFPGEKIEYYPNPQNPWEYKWVNFMGVKAKYFFERALFSPENPVYCCNDPAIGQGFSKLIEANSESTRDILTVAYLYEIFAKIISERQTFVVGLNTLQEDYLSASLTFIEQNYHNPDLSLPMLAKHLGLNPSYLSRLFKEEAGLPFVQYVLRYRIQKSLDYLVKASYTNKEIAYSIGFSDPFYFSKKFKEMTNMSPAEYRKKVRKTNEASE